MKKIITLSAGIIFSANVFSQPFWSDDFGTGCDAGNIVYTGPGGPWQYSFVGPQDLYHDMFYISASANNNGIGNCATTCSGGLNRTLHIGISSGFLNNDLTCSYTTGVNCLSLGECATSNIRAETPNIDFTGKFDITMSFIYLENGEDSDDDASLWGFNGVSWILIDPLPKTTVCNGTSGIWTTYSALLPQSFDNVWNVRLGFLWVNDNDGFGDDPPFAVDDISLTAGISTYINNLTPINISLSPNPAMNQLTIDNGELKIEQVEIYNVLGEKRLTLNPSPKGEGLRVDVSSLAAGIYFVKVRGEKEERVAKFVKQ